MFRLRIQLLHETREQDYCDRNEADHCYDRARTRLGDEICQISLIHEPSGLILRRWTAPADEPAVIALPVPTNSPPRSA